jgi:hypothetical protein
MRKGEKILKIVLSPAKKMNTDTDTLAHEGLERL